MEGSRGCKALKYTILTDPVEALYLVTLLLGVIVLALIVVYYGLRSKRVRYTTTYLSGEPESAVSSISPSIASLYWGFMRRFAKTLYRHLVESVHTGSLHDWYRFLSSWLALLLLMSIIALALHALMR
jgi:hypothetical protein